MKPVSKVEIIIDSLEVENVVKLLDEVGVSGYSIINNVAGIMWPEKEAGE